MQASPLLLTRVTCMISGGTCAMQAMTAVVVLFSRGSAAMRDVQVKDLVTQGCLMLEPFFSGSLSPSGSVLAWQSLE